MQKFLGIVIAVVIAVVAAWYFALWKPLDHRVAAANATRSQAATNVAGLRAQVAAFVTEERHAPAERRALRKLQEAVPNSPELSTALRDLASAAAASGAALSTISPSAPVAPATGTTTAGPTALTLSLAATGSYRQVTGFVRDVESLPRLFVISNFSLAGGSAGAGSGRNANPAGSAATSMSLSLSLDMFYGSSKG